MMNKQQKLALGVALMLGTGVGAQTLGMSEASAAISDKFRLEVNGVTSYVHDKHMLSGTDSGADGYWSQYFRIPITYYASRNVQLRARWHSGYDAVSTNYFHNSRRGYFGQMYLQVRDRPAKVTYTLGKKGAFLGQGLIHNSTDNITGAQVSIGNWYDPQCLSFILGYKRNGDRFFSAQYTKDIMKHWQISTTYVNHPSKNTYLYELDDAGTTNGNLLDGTRVRISPAKYKHSKLNLLSFGTKAKLPKFTIQGEFVQNFSELTGQGRVVKVGNYNDTLPVNSLNSRRAWYVEVFTGPTSDTTSGLPLYKKGTEVWSLKYQDIGANAVDAHNTTFFDDAKGWRLVYAKVIKKGIVAEFNVARMKDKGDKELYDTTYNGKWKTEYVAALNYKFR